MRNRPLVMVMLSAAVLLLVTIFVLRSQQLTDRRPLRQTHRHPHGLFRGGEKKPMRLVGGEMCQPVMKYFLLKTHKCASTSLQNVMYRFAYDHELTVVLPAAGNFFTSIGWPLPPRAEHLMPHPHGEKFDVLANHIIYDSQFVTDFLGNNVMRLAAVREPWSHFRSYWNFFGITSQLNTPLDEFLLSKRRDEWVFNGYPSQGHIPLRHILSVQFGLSDSDLKTNVSRIKFLDRIMKEFDFIFVAEYVTESMIVLKNIMCWSFKDVAILGLNKSGKDRNQYPLSPGTQERHQKWSWLDYELYERANSSLWKKIQQIPDFDDQVTKLKSLQQNIADFMSLKNKSLTLRVDNLGEENVTYINQRYIDQLQLLDVSFNEMFLKRQHPQLNTDRFRHECCKL